MTTKHTDNIENILEVEGVNAKGYGVLSQAAMFDRDLSPQSKAIYAYFVSYTGSGRTVFPKRETILADLKLSKNTFYKHFKPLVENGYIKISKAKGFKNKNVYTICNSPKKINCNIESDNTESLLSIDGINANGFGFIPKLIMCDKRLSIKSKALIAFFYSIVQAGCRAFPHRSTICVFLGLSKDTYYKSLNQLIDCNYITVMQRHTKKGCFSVNDYILNSNPSKTPCPENCDITKIENNSDFSPCPKNKDIPKDNRVLNLETLPCPENCDNNNSTSINSSNNISSSNLTLSSIVYTQNESEIRQMIYTLTRYVDYSSCDDEFAKKYCKAVRLLIEMLCVSEHAMYGNQIIKTSALFEYLEECICEDVDGLSLRDLICQTIWHYDLCCEKYNIRQPVQYLKALLWDEIKNFDL